MLSWNEAKALIEEARVLKYRGTQWERELVSRLESMQPSVLRPEDEYSLLRLYRRAAGGEGVKNYAKPRFR